MPSAIDPTKPEAGSATTESVRDNFLAAKDEIDELQELLSGWTAFTPEFEFAVPGSSSFTYGIQIGRSKSIGTITIVQFHILLTARTLGTGSGELRLKNLPIPAGSAPPARILGGCYAAGFSGSWPTQCQINPGESHINFGKNTGGADTTIVQGSHTTNTSDLYGTIIYEN